MIFKNVFVQFIIVCILLGIISSVIRKLFDFDFNPFATGLIMGFVVYILIKYKKPIDKSVKPE